MMLERVNYLLSVEVRLPREEMVDRLSAIIFAASTRTSRRCAGTAGAASPGRYRFHFRAASPGLHRIRCQVQGTPDGIGGQPRARVLRGQIHQSARAQISHRGQRFPRRRDIMHAEYSRSQPAEIASAAIVPPPLGDAKPQGLADEVLVETATRTGQPVRVSSRAAASAPASATCLAEVVRGSTRILSGRTPAATARRPRRPRTRQQPR